MSEHDIPQPSDSKHDKEEPIDLLAQSPDNGDVPAPEPTGKLDELLETAAEVFNDVSMTIKGVGDTHLQSHPEVVARDERRKRALETLRNALRGYMTEGHFNIDAMHLVQAYEDTARAGNRDVHQLTEYLYTPDSAYATSSHTRQAKSFLEEQAAKYVNSSEEATHEDVPEKFIEGLQQISEASELFVELGDKLQKLFKADRDVQDGFRLLRSRLENLPLTYDENAMISTWGVLNDLIAFVEDSDRSRDAVSKVAGQLRNVAGKIEDAGNR